jgi:hypothetical protein
MIRKVSVKKITNYCYPFLAGFLFELFFDLKMKATYSTEMSVDVQRTTVCYIPEDGAVHNHCCENLKSYGLNEVHCKIESICSCNVHYMCSHLYGAPIEIIPACQSASIYSTKQLEDW